MNAIAVFNQPFTIAETVINQIDGLYSLNDLHKASGNEEKHKPAFFLRNSQAKEIIAELQKCNSLKDIITIKRGGVTQGTYACKEIIYSYAMWISAKFHLYVVKAFDAMITRTDSEQRKYLVAACTKLSVKNMNISDVYKMVGNHFGYDEGIKHIPTPLLPEAVAYVYEQILSRNKANFVPPTDTPPRYDHTLDLLLNRCADIALNMAQITNALGTVDKRRQAQGVIDDIYQYQDSIRYAK